MFIIVAGKETKKGILSFLQKLKGYPASNRSKPGLLPHTRVKRNPIARRIRKNSPPANMGNLCLRHQNLATKRLDLRKGSINIICRDIDEQAISLIFDRKATLAYLDKAPARATFRRELHIVVCWVSLNFPAKEVTVKLSSFLGFLRRNFTFQLPRLSSPEFQCVQLDGLTCGYSPFNVSDSKIVTSYKHQKKV